MLRDVVCIYEEKLLINASGAGVLPMLLISSLPFRIFNASSPVGWAGAGWDVLHLIKGRTFDLDGFNAHQTRKHGMSLVEPGTFLPRGRDLTTRPPRPCKM
ncbi:hypothetical protein AVEN_224958-1 [Araneus ventricosus]|uniref:Uncharacterized protein n=1 Tax=Araneus ventricosus TaxID=182803 RepID=A0A4Y2U131_ARAVE|nr:hypothetical protein AVEN_224958-1 [Araneus ventricosus]